MEHSLEEGGGETLLIVDMANRRLQQHKHHLQLPCICMDLALFKVFILH